jgi:oligopeptide/dipeptide ABC transporter ATP-binding protein
VSDAAATPLLAVSDLTVEYSLGGNVFGGKNKLRAADRVSFEICKGQTLGLVGESGSGKSTVGRAIAGLTPITAGTVAFNGTQISGLRGGARRKLATSIQMLFQDPYGSLNPRITVGKAVWEAPRFHALEGWRAKPREKTAEILARMGLPEDVIDRYPHEFSGGQRQRVALARALAMGPQLIVLDEPTSALDVSMSAQVLNLLADLQAERKLTYLVIGHNLALIEKASDHIAVMYSGQIVELAPGKDLLATPAHPYTRMLLETAGGARTKTPPAEGQFEGSGETGCRFAPRCPKVDEACRRTAPDFSEVRPGHTVRCPRWG